MTSRRALVTGAPGFIGRRVVQRLLDAQWDVTSFSLPGEASHSAWTGRVRMAHGDLVDAEAVSAAAEGATLAVHLAAPVGVAGRYDWQLTTMVHGTQSVCRAMAAMGGRVVVVSSIAVYGDLIQRQICHEDDGFGAWQGAYGRAKQAKERIALELAATYSIPMTIIRPGNVYGLGGASAWGDRLIDLVRQTGGAVIGDGEANDAGLVHADNLADAIYLAATRAEAVGRTYNVVDGNGITWRRFMDDMALLAGKPPPPNYPLDSVIDAALANEDPAACRDPVDPAIPTLEGLNLIAYDNRIDASRIRSELGWSPSLSYADAFVRMRELMRA